MEILKDYRKTTSIVSNCIFYHKEHKVFSQSSQKIKYQFFIIKVV